MLQNLWEQTLATLPAYLPNLMAALAILVFGWIGALIVGAIVRGALRRTTLDNRLAGWLAGEGGGDVEIERVAYRYRCIRHIDFAEIRDNTFILRSHSTPFLQHKRKKNEPR